MASNLETEFETALRDAARICWTDYKYRPSYFLTMLGERGGVGTAKALLNKSSPSEGFVKLVVDYNRPDLTVEHLVSDPKYMSLFSSEETAKARRWLARS